MSDEVTEAARLAGERRVAEIADYAGASDIQRESIARLERLIRHGGSVDVVVRRHGQDHHFEADWLKQLFRERELKWPPSHTGGQWEERT